MPSLMQLSIVRKEKMAGILSANILRGLNSKLPWAMGAALATTALASDRTKAAPTFTPPLVPRVTIAKRALEGENMIRQQFALQAALDGKLAAKSLKPTLKLSIGQPHLPPSPVRDAALRDLAEGTDSIPRGYSPSKGFPQYVRNATALFNHRIPGLNASDENVLFTAGGTGALAAICAVLLEPGDKVLFPTPGFAAQPPAIEGYGATVVPVPTHDSGYKVTAERLDEILSHNPTAKLMVLNDITNPTGAKYTTAELRSIGKVLERHPNVLIFSDETYHDLAFDPHAKFFLEVNPDLQNRTIVEYSGAKDIAGDPGARIGMVYAPTVHDSEGKLVNLAEKMAGQQLNMCTAIPTIVQHFAALIIGAKLGGRFHTEHSAWESMITEEYRKNLTIAKEEFEGVGMPTMLEPGGGFFLLVSGEKFIGQKIPNEVTSKNGMEITDLHKQIGGDVLDSDLKVAKYLALVANMVVVPASPFGMPPEIGALRVSVATSQENLRQIPEHVRYAEEQLLPVKKWADRVTTPATPDRGIAA